MYKYKVVKDGKWLIIPKNHPIYKTRQAPLISATSLDEAVTEARRLYGHKVDVEFFSSASSVWTP